MMPLFPLVFLWLIAIKNKRLFYPLMHWKESIGPETLSSRQEESWLWQITTLDCSCCLKPHCRLSSSKKKDKRKKPTSIFPKIFLSMWTFFSSLGVILKTWSLWGWGGGSSELCESVTCFFFKGHIHTHRYKVIYFYFFCYCLVAAYALSFLLAGAACYIFSFKLCVSLVPCHRSESQHRPQNL